jgi:hypothetical protein
VLPEGPADAAADTLGRHEQIREDARWGVAGERVEADDLAVALGDGDPLALDILGREGQLGPAGV